MGLVMSAVGNAQQVSHQASTTEGFAAVSVIDGRPDALMAKPISGLDEKRLVIQTCFNSAAPGDARGAEAVTTSCSLPGTTWEAVMRLAIRQPKCGHVENAR
jgi:hypothetical protein